MLVNGATNSKLSEAWIQKLKDLPVYEPSALTLAVRAAVPRPEAMRKMTFEELAEHDGKHEGKDVFCSSLGYVFKHKEMFSAFHGRDCTNRNMMHRRGMNLEKHDVGFVVPDLLKADQEEIEYALRWRDRM